MSAELIFLTIMLAVIGIPVGLMSLTIKRNVTPPRPRRPKKI